ncbi:Hypothetical predicted protein [Marmota monax]|uniref:Uncharacterized protein n=1 Tax=Marmota monax TaxID=9995 RepID=A0A5E4AP34_MARMO|nr:hypothetical protein GHT09_016280 [Marmota monax]VTJ58690.1 Hypothetical predicted protein [Marmota monax]
MARLPAGMWSADLMAHTETAETHTWIPHQPVATDPPSSGATVRDNLLLRGGAHQLWAKSMAALTAKNSLHLEWKLPHCRSAVLCASVGSSGW